MTIKKIATAAFVGGAILAAATPAQAVVTQFASFQSAAGGSSMRWQNDNVDEKSGTGGSLYTVSNDAATSVGSHAVIFSLMQPSSSFVTAVNASFTLNASTVGSPAAIVGTFLKQTVSAGTFSFLSTEAVVIGGQTYAAGSNLLSATFSSTSILGERYSDAATFGGSASTGSTISYTSDFLSFNDLAQLEFGLSLTAVTSALQAISSQGVSSRALRTFRSDASGSFSSAIPEPAVWSLMIVGFTMVGLQTRRRGTRVAA